MNAEQIASNIIEHMEEEYEPIPPPDFNTLNKKEGLQSNDKKQENIKTQSPKPQHKEISIEKEKP
jgi:hypothetical protein